MKYTTPEMENVMFTAEEVIVASGEGNGDGPDTGEGEDW